jgi:hypothetical protein
VSFALPTDEEMTLVRSRIIEHLVLHEPLPGMCVCVCLGERGRERGREKESLSFSTLLSLLCCFEFRSLTSLLS